MSASLVGSEMCIRDSALTRERAHWLSSLSNMELRPPPTWSPRRSSTFVPVSYTHLTLPTICSV
eukprot:2216059-Alexandrium_andersonii.AAC.1